MDAVVEDGDEVVDRGDDVFELLHDAVTSAKPATAPTATRQGNRRPDDVRERFIAQFIAQCSFGDGCPSVTSAGGHVQSYQPKIS